MSIKKRSISDEILQVVLLLKNYYLGAHNNWYNEINRSELNLKD